MSREGRAQPIQPFVSHGFLGNTPANGVLPGRVTVVENDDRRRKTPPLQPLILNGLYATVTAPTFVAPPSVVNVDRPVPARPAVLAPFSVATHGFVTPAPPPPTFSIQPERPRTTVPPIVISGVYATTTGSNLPLTVATINATSDMTASVVRLRPVTGATVNATSSMTASLQALRSISTATINATSNMSASLQALRSVTGATINATSNVTASITKSGGRAEWMWSSGWHLVTPKDWNGSAWVTPTPKLRVGGTWT